MITGRDASNDLIEISDLVSDIQEIKHPYTQHIPPQSMIEF